MKSWTNKRKDEEIEMYCRKNHYILLEWSQYQFEVDGKLKLPIRTFRVMSKKSTFKKAKIQQRN